MPEPIVVPFQGEWIECETGLDAVAIKAADDYLAAREDTTPAELERLAGILSHYHREAAAEKLWEHAKRKRAAEFLVNAVTPK
jgi:hypothetical protein